MRTVWPFFLDNMLQHPVERFREELTDPHVDDGELACLHS